MKRNFRHLVCQSRDLLYGGLTRTAVSLKTVVLLPITTRSPEEGKAFHIGKEVKHFLPGQTALSSATDQGIL